jgi:DNA-binding IclR family transcriptional regulator
MKRPQDAFVASTMKNTRQIYSAPALEKGLAIVELLASSPKPLSTRAIAERLGRSKGEIFRMVFVLVERGYLMRDAATDELTLSNRLFELGMRTPRSRQLVEVAVPAMERLSDQTGHSSHLVVINKGETVVIATATGSAEISFTLRLGYRRPALDATSGQVIIAFQDLERRQAMIKDSAAIRRLPATASKLAKQLDAIATRGFLIAASHDVVGVTDICAPILDKQMRGIASIVVPYLNRHAATTRHDDVVFPLIETCRSIGDALKNLTAHNTGGA